MVVTQEQLDSFHEFGTRQLQGGNGEISWNELFALWRIENPTDEERVEVNAIIRQGIRDIDAGRGRPAQEVMEELRQKHNLPSE